MPYGKTIRLAAAAILVTVCFFASRSFSADAKLSSSEETEFFEKRIRPILADNCYQCHTEGKKVKGGLALDSRAALLRGGDAGPVIVAGDPEKSKLIEAVRYKNRDMQMPPKGALSPEQINDLISWVKIGAPDPREAPSNVASAKRTINIDEGRKFWSFVPLADPAAPDVKNKPWVKSPIDAFVLAELEKAGLPPAAPADKRTLIRRATYDLTGLPPKPSDVDAFVADQKPDAFSKVVERLLASPQYGERWGRHWLDVARYADSNGMDENVAFGNAWRYRDYVIRAFNSDKPFDQFIMEQIAGDLLPVSEQTTHEDSLTATGFFSLGARVLAEPDIRKLQMDIIDEQIDVMGKAFMGMTLGCCRCHDHKFDPISTTDYYAMAAIFHGTQSLSTEHNGAIKFWFEHSMAAPDIVAARKKQQAAITAQTAKIAAFSKKQRADLREELDSHAADYLAAAAQITDDVPFTEAKALATDHHLRPRYLVACRHYLTRHPEHPFFASWRELAAARQYDRIKEVYSPLFADAKTEYSKKPSKTPAPATQPAVVAAHGALTDIAGFLAIPDKDADAFDADMFSMAGKMKAELKALEEALPDLPGLMGVADGQVTPSIQVHIRGNYLTLGANVTRGFPRVMSFSTSMPIFPAKHSGRLELARWLASSEHPLTARVMANRLWRWHFGRGIVGTVDNFGATGDRPTHPELLDFLARRFIEEGWSVKQMHRLLMNSSAYQMASRNESATAALTCDPENKLLWRANIQRLEAEEIRDAMLVVSGSLDLKMGGKTIALHNHEFVFNHTSEDNSVYESLRRAIYIPVIRNHLYDMLEQFDYPDPTMPTGSRNATVVAPQALQMLNSPFVMDCADKLASDIQKVSNSDEARLAKAYELLYSRQPSENEMKRALSFIEACPDSAAGWRRLCHVLLSANEFMYLR